MFLCLSSGAREQYRKDVILALAMPEESRLQFRYDRKWIAPNVLDKIQDGSCVGVQALITYIDQHDKTMTPYLTPCRFASISDAHIYGTTVILGLSLREFAYADNLDLFNSQARSLSQNAMPTWGEAGRPTGYYCVDIDLSEASALISSTELYIWENIVTQIAQRADFISEKCFYILEGIRDVCTKELVNLQGNCFPLKPSRAYQIEIYHFHPLEGKSKAFLRLQTQTPSIRLTSNPTLTINSRYDVKRVRFETARPTTSEAAVVSIFRGDDFTADKFGVLDFDLELSICGIWMWKLVAGISIGILLAAPHITAALWNSQLSAASKSAITIVSLIAGLAAGLVASFSLNKSL